MSLLGLLFLLVAQYIAGFGLLRFFKLELSNMKSNALRFILGVLVLSFLPFLLQLFYIPINFYSVLSSIILTCGLLNIPFLKQLKTGAKAKLFFKLPKVQLYEIPFLVVFAVLLISSSWRAFYYPPEARDMLSGPEVMAEYTVREGTMINSMFSVNLETTNNYQKPPFITSLQIIYKLFGFPFGQIWLSVLVIAFVVFLYQVLRDKLHPIVAGTLLLIFLAIPELYSYSFIMLFDYSNMILFFLGCYFLFDYFLSGKNNAFYFSVLLFAFASYIRLETIVFLAFLLPAFWTFAIKNKMTIKPIFFKSLLMLSMPAIIYLLWVNVFMKFYFPISFQLSSNINPNLFDLSPIFSKFQEMNATLIIGKFHTLLWGYYFQFFVITVILDVLIFRKMNREFRNWFYAAAIIYFGLPILGYLFPLVDIINTTKRGLFKMMPLMLMVIMNTNLIQKLSSKIADWEHGKNENAQEVMPAFVPKQSQNNKL